MLKPWLRTVAGVLALLSLSGCEWDLEETTQLPRGSQVMWDGDGVPHIYAWRSDSLAYAFGRAQMQMHPELLLRLYAQARGRSAEYYGPVFMQGDPFPTDLVEVDTLVRTMGFPARAQTWLNQQSPRMRAFIDSFVEGINAQAASMALSPEAKAVLPVRSEDVMAHTLRLFFSYLSGATTTGEPNCSLIYPNPAATPFNLIGGSNGWALGPKRTASGHAMLLANPHLVWGGTHTWFEAHFSSPTYQIYGATLVGLPVMRIGFNQQLGWVHTVNSQDGCDLYELKPSGEGYLLDGQTRSFEQRQETLLIKQPDGSQLATTLHLRRSIHGPVFEKAGKVYAMRIVGVDQLPTPGVLEQWWDMAQARHFGAFKQIVTRLQNPYHNILYADRDRNIWGVFGGLTPRRPQGDAAFWAQPVDGSRSDLIWHDALRLSELPQAINPESGWVQNSNSVPWTMTKPNLNPTHYPAYLSPYVSPLLREQRGIQLIEQSAPFTLDSLMTAKHDTRALLADRVLDDLIRFALASGQPALQQAAQVLGGWDRRTDAHSRGAVLFAAWVAVMGGDEALPYRDPADPRRPDTTPAGLTDPVASLTALGKALAILGQVGVAPDVAFGEVYRFRKGKPGSAHFVDHPANGGSESLGVFRTFGYIDDSDGRQRAIFGDTFSALVEFSSPVRAKVIHTYGNSSQPDSPHYGDQLALAARQGMRDARLSWPEVQRATVRQERFKR
ncbi:acyl-homoserine-lactone acylase [Chitinivorax tropicus]|uniref:Acyl-homoserine-lactone acylase n=1 Tax=Chitinivorax tropicus TaxID=714531 RepID=A0A840MGU1_9PROT|nr:penicillin acylase family protein [Chitinivorax tropicus]MBB5016745.1 acyl-homoserine-lactone acylase [Chitinivorax tropicus]